MPRCEQSSAFQDFGAIIRQFRLPLAGAGHDLSSSRAFKRAMLASNLPGIWRMSAKSKLPRYRKLAKVCLGIQ
jgi:hypothetical protein